MTSVSNLGFYEFPESLILYLNFLLEYFHQCQCLEVHFQTHSRFLFFYFNIFICFNSICLNFFFPLKSSIEIILGLIIFFSCFKRFFFLLKSFEWIEKDYWWEDCLVTRFKNQCLLHIKKDHLLFKMLKSY